MSRSYYNKNKKKTTTLVGNIVLAVLPVMVSLMVTTNSH